MKQVTIIGNLGSNAVLRTTSEGKNLMTFSIAVSQKGTDPLWFNCVCNYREKVFPYLVKGTNVCAMGDLQVSLYNGKIDLSVNVDKIELCGTKREDTPVSTDETIQETF